MASVRLVTDSSCDLPIDVVEAHGIIVVPLTIRFGEEEIVDDADLTAKRFYDRMASFDGLPETAAPAPGAFEAAFRAQAAAGAEAVVCINLSSALVMTAPRRGWPGRPRSPRSAARSRRPHPCTRWWPARRPRARPTAAP